MIQISRYIIFLNTQVADFFVYFHNPRSAFTLSSFVPPIQYMISCHSYRTNGKNFVITFRTHLWNQDGHIPFMIQKSLRIEKLLSIYSLSDVNIFLIRDLSFLSTIQQDRKYLSQSLSPQYCSFAIYILFKFSKTFLANMIIQYDCS